MQRDGRMTRGGAARALVLVLAATIATLAWQASRPPCCDAPPAAASVDGAARATTPALAHAPARAGAGTRNAAPVVSPPASASHEASSLRALLQRPPAELRASVLQALARSGDGGRLYARHLLRQCAAADAVAGLHAPEGDDPGRLVSPDATDPRAARALDRLQKLRAACAQFTPSERAAATNIVANGGSDADPMLAQLDRAAATPEDEREQLRQLLGRPDALLLEELAPRLALHTVAGQQGWWFDGLRVPPDVAEPALALLPCAFGLPCDESDPAVWGACLQGQTCAGDRTALVLQQAAGDDPARRQQILALARRMSQAVRAGDVDRFMPPPVPVR